MSHISKIQYVPIKNVWPKEEGDFTPWLQDNIEEISKIIGINIVNPEIEHHLNELNGFRADIRAELETGEAIIIENQYGQSNHDHLGKVLTYRTSFDAKIAIWVVEKARQEHIEVINWLNENDNGCAFFLLRIQAIKIGDSPIAPMFSIIAGPSEDIKNIGQIKKEDQKRHIERRKFWGLLLDIAKGKNISLLSKISPTKDSWISAGAGKSGLGYHLWLNKNSMRIELRIDSTDPDANSKIFNKLKQHQSNINSNCGDNLDWVEEEGVRRRAIQTTIPGGWADDPSTWNTTIENALVALVNMEKAIKPYLKNL